MMKKMISSFRLVWLAGFLWSAGQSFQPFQPAAHHHRSRPLLTQFQVLPLEGIDPTAAVATAIIATGLAATISMTPAEKEQKKNTVFEKAVLAAGLELQQELQQKEQQQEEMNGKAAAAAAVLADEKGAEIKQKVDQEKEVKQGVLEADLEEQQMKLEEINNGKSAVATKDEKIDQVALEKEEAREMVTATAATEQTGEVDKPKERPYGFNTFRKKSEPEEPAVVSPAEPTVKSKMEEFNAFLESEDESFQLVDDPSESSKEASKDETPSFVKILQQGEQIKSEKKKSPIEMNPTSSAEIVEPRQITIDQEADVDMTATTNRAEPYKPAQSEAREPTDSALQKESSALEGDATLDANPTESVQSLEERDGLTNTIRQQIQQRARQQTLARMDQRRQNKKDKLVLGEVFNNVRKSEKNHPVLLKTSEMPDGGISGSEPVNGDVKQSNVVVSEEIKVDEFSSEPATEEAPSSKTLSFLAATKSSNEAAAVPNETKKTRGLAKNPKILIGAGALLVLGGRVLKMVVSRGIL